MSTIVGVRSPPTSIAIDNGNIAEVSGAMLWNHTSYSQSHLASRIKTIGGTGNGSDCVFPFTYQGSSFSTCIYRTETIGSMKSFALFCSTTANLDQQGLWGYCLGTRSVPLLRSCHCVRLSNHIDYESCYFPFTYNGISYSDCISGPHSPRWCSTTAK